MIFFDDDLYIAHALADKLIETIDELGFFRYGHLTGIEAIKQIYANRVRQDIPSTVKIPKKVLEATIEKLRARIYDGKSIDSVVKETTQNLGERLQLLKSIQIHNTTERLLSKDTEYTLPSYTARNVNIPDSEVSVCSRLFTELGEKPHSRNEIMECLERNNITIRNLDAIIHYLVQTNLI
jgi:hypothetical protein